MSLPEPLPTWRDRWSGLPGGAVVLDLGEQPASDLFPLPDDPQPDPRYPVRLVLSDTSRLVQLEEDTTTPEEVLGVEPAAMVRQAELCVEDATRAGYVFEGARALEYPSPHGGSWEKQLAQRGAVEVSTGEADVVVDVHGIMHDADQRAALEERVSHLAPDGVLLVMFHNLSAVMRHGMWNTIKTGHFAYYSTPALVGMAADLGLVAVDVWQYPLHNGTTMLAFARSGSRHGGQSDDVTALIAEEDRLGVTDPVKVSALGDELSRSVADIRDYLAAARARGLRVAGYGAASRTAALLCSADVTRDDVTAVADAAVGKHGRTMPVNRIPIVSPQDLARSRPDRVLLFVADLLPEVRAALPEIEGSGGRWVVMDPRPREVEPA